MQFLERSKSKRKLRNIDDSQLYTYLKNKLETFTTVFIEWIITTTSIFLKADIERFDIILGRLWLKKTKLFINWENDY